MNNILVPIDFSEVSEHASRLAADLAAKLNAELHLVNFTAHPFGSTFSVTGEVGGTEEIDLFTIELLKKNRERIVALAEKLNDQCTVHYHIYDADYDEGFLPYIRENNIDLVVMGTSGEETATEYFTGNHTEQMIQKATCPVISLKGAYNSTAFQNFVLGIDLEHDRHDNYSRASELVSKFANSLEANVHMVHVADLNANTEALNDQIQEFVGKYQFEGHVDITQNNNKEEGLLAYAYAHGANMLITMTHSTGGVLNFLNRSTSEELSKSSPIPVMAINLHNI